jgi:hypothetical protein
MNTPDHVVAARHAMSEAQRAFNSSLDHAGNTLDSRLTEASQLVWHAAAEVASLQSALELYDGLEQTRLAAKTRLEIATAVSAHRDAVDRAKVLQREAWTGYHQSVMAAATQLAETRIDAPHHEGKRETD